MKTNLEYQLQACRNLEAEMLAVGDAESAAHFRQRAAQVSRSLQTATSQKKSSIVNPKS